ncbi:MAG: hypothetical protein ACFE9L_16105 [Candidatus Hodarchaeota archaeon]
MHVSRDNTHDQKALDSTHSQGELSSSQEQEENWFTGTLISDLCVPQSDLSRLKSLHNRITHEETQNSDRFQNNLHVARQLSQFFPLKWMNTITKRLRTIESTKLGIRTREHRVGSYLGYLEIELNFKRMTIHDSTLAEINKALGTTLNKHTVRSWKLKFLRIIPELKKEWIEIRQEAHKVACVNTTVQVMNTKMVLNGYSKHELFKIKQKIFSLTKQFAETNRCKHIKKHEVWAQAICLRGIRTTVNPQCKTTDIFPHPQFNSAKTIENKAW